MPFVFFHGWVFLPSFACVNMAEGAGRSQAGGPLQQERADQGKEVPQVPLPGLSRATGDQDPGPSCQSPGPLFPYSWCKHQGSVRRTGEQCKVGHLLRPCTTVLDHARAISLFQNLWELQIKKRQGKDEGSPSRLGRPLQRQGCVVSIPVSPCPRWPARVQAFRGGGYAQGSPKRMEARWRFPTVTLAGFPGRWAERLMDGDGLMAPGATT